MGVAVAMVACLGAGALAVRVGPAAQAGASGGLVAEAPTSAAPDPGGQAAPAPAFDSARAWEHLRQLVTIGPRPAGSPGMRQMRAYVTRQLGDMGLTVQEQRFTAGTPVGPVEMSNLIVRLPGSRPEKILLTGHYATKLFRDATFVGANDGGSSAAFLIELARGLKDRPREFTWELVWFDGEEAFCLDWYECKAPDGGPDNTYGSRHYVQAARDAGQIKALRAMILVDMIAGRDVRFPRESYSTAWLKDIIWTTAAELGHRGTFPMTEAGQIEDDHVAFVKAGVPAVDLIGLNNYPYWHTPGDTLDKLSAQSLQIVGDVLLASLPKIEAHLLR
jgi:hypothetical protein